MTTETKDAIVLRLRAALVGLPTYRGQARIFAADKVPGDCPRPYVTVFGPIGARDFDTKTGPDGGDDGAWYVLDFDVNVYGDAAGDPAVVDSYTDAAVGALNRRAQDLLVSGWTTLIVRARAGVVAPTDDSVYGRNVNVSVMLRPFS